MTALFCDLVGFTPLSASLDPEEVRDLQAAYFGRMAEQIERYGGIVEKYAGDAVLALFGAPIAHEDDAERAVLCALGMQEAIEPVAASARARWQVEPAIRVGVNTGEVVSGIWEAGDRQDVAVTGDAINTAARIQGAAEPGEVLVGAETMRLTRRRIRYGERRELVLKGKMGTVPGHPALGVREAVGERWEEGERMTPLVGRERELERLLEAWTRAQASEGQIISLVGEPGVGKSRLIAEAVERIGSGDVVRIVRARCLSYGQEISLWLLADLLRNLFGIREQDVLEEVRAKLEAAIRTLLTGPGEPARTEALDVLGEVLGLPAGDSMVANAGPQVRRQALLRALRLVLAAVAERARTVLVLEDLHWIDQASEEVLREVLADVPGSRLLVLAAQRPGWTAPWSEWGWTERITLHPLREHDAATLAGAVLGGMTLSADLERYVADRAGGNPFFVEEMLRALEEAGGLEQRDGVMHLMPGAAQRLPSSLTEVLLARLDRLEGQVRNVAQVGSVIGRSFAVRLLAQVMEREQTALDLPLTALQQAEIAFPRRGSDLEYVFKHVSMRDAAYNTLVQRRRQELHLQTARAIAALYPSDEYVEIIAYHYGKTDASEAAEWLERAGDRAAAIYATESAMGHYREARRRLEHAEAQSLDLARLDEKLGGVLYTVGRFEEALAALERSAQAYRQERDLEAAGRVVARVGEVYRALGAPEKVIARVQPMIELLSRSGPSAALASLYMSLAAAFQLTGRYGELLEAAERAAEIARSVGDDALLGQVGERRAVGLLYSGRAEEALHSLEETLPLVEAAGDLVVLRRALTTASYACWLLGRIDGIRGYDERTLEVAERLGDPGFTAFCRANYAETLFIVGEWEQAQTQSDLAMDLIQSGERSAHWTGPLHRRGEMALRTGRWDLAGDFLDESLRFSEEVNNRETMEQTQTSLAELDVRQGRAEVAARRLEPLAAETGVSMMVLPMLAWAYLEADDPARAQSMADNAVTRAREGERFFLPEALRVQGMVLLRQGRPAEAESVQREALELVRAFPYPYAEARILVQMALLDERRGDYVRARERVGEALTIFRRLGAAKDIEEAERVLSARDQTPG